MTLGFKYRNYKKNFAIKILLLFVALTLISMISRQEKQSAREEIQWSLKDSVGDETKVFAEESVPEGTKILPKEKEEFKLQSKEGNQKQSLQEETKLMTTSKEDKEIKVPVKESVKDEYNPPSMDYVKGEINIPPKKQEEIKDPQKESVEKNNEAEESKKLLLNPNVTAILSRNMIGRYNTILIANSGHLDFLLNFQIGFNRVVRSDEQNRFIVIALDKKVCYSLSDTGMNVILASEILSELELPEDEATWLSPAYNKLTNAKIDIALVLIRDYKINLFFSDADIVFTSRKIYDYFDMFYDRFDVLMSTDGFGMPEYLCTGFYMAKPSAFAIQFFTMIAQAEDSVNDQDIANRIFPTLPGDLKIRLHLLPGLLFPNGNMILNGLLEHFNITPWMIHANYVIGKEKKTKMIKDKGYWFI